MVTWGVKSPEQDGAPQLHAMGVCIADSSTFSLMA